MKSSVTLQELALVQMQGGTIGATVEYPGFSNRRNAERAAQRDLRAMATPLLSCTIYCGQEAADLDIGDTFKFEWPDYHEGAIVMRVTGMAFGDGRTDRVRIDCVQDVFAAPLESILSEDRGSLWTNPSRPPGNIEEGEASVSSDSDQLIAATTQIAVEMPYRRLIEVVGSRLIDDYLAETPDVGILQTTGKRPLSGLQDDGTFFGNAINALIYVDAGSGYVQRGAASFAPFARLADDVMDSISGSTVTFGRGILDTVPMPHLAGASILFWQGFAGTNNTEYEATESINVKLQPRNNSGTASLASAIPMPLTFDSRAIRPYPPGNVKINGVAYPETDLGSDPLTITWSHRDRLQQTGATFEDTTDGNIGPESGTTYFLEASSPSGDVVFSTQVGSSTELVGGDLSLSMQTVTVSYQEKPMYVHFDGTYFYQEYLRSGRWIIRRASALSADAADLRWELVSDSAVERMKGREADGANGARRYTVGEIAYLTHSGTTYSLRLFGRSPVSNDISPDPYTDYIAASLYDDTDSYNSGTVPGASGVIGCHAIGTKFYVVNSSKQVWSKDISGGSGVAEAWVAESSFVIDRTLTDKCMTKFATINGIHYLLYHVQAQADCGLFRSADFITWTICPGTSMGNLGTFSFSALRPWDFAGTEDEILLTCYANDAGTDKGVVLRSTDGTNFTTVDEEAAFFLSPGLPDLPTRGFVAEKQGGKSVFAGFSLGSSIWYQTKYWVRVDGEWGDISRNYQFPRLASVNMAIGNGEVLKDYQQIVYEEASSEVFITEGDTEAVVAFDTVEDGYYEIRLWSVRDGYSSWQQHVIPVLRAPLPVESSS